MWLCNVFTILVCLTAVDNFDAVQEARYGKLIAPPRKSINDECYVQEVNTPEHPLETVVSDSEQH